MTRATALSSCRRVLSAQGDSISKADLLELFSSKELSDRIFDLLIDSQGQAAGTSLDVQDVVDTTQNNLSK